MEQYEDIKGKPGEIILTGESGAVLKMVTTKEQQMQIENAIK